MAGGEFRRGLQQRSVPGVAVRAPRPSAAGEVGPAKSGPATKPARSTAAARRLRRSSAGHPHRCWWVEGALGAASPAPVLPGGSGPATVTGPALPGEIFPQPPPPPLPARRQPSACGGRPHRFPGRAGVSLVASPPAGPFPRDPGRLSPESTPPRPGATRSASRTTPVGAGRRARRPSVVAGRSPAAAPSAPPAVAPLPPRLPPRPFGSARRRVDFAGAGVIHSLPLYALSRVVRIVFCRSLPVLPILRPDPAQAASDGPLPGTPARRLFDGARPERRAIPFPSYRR